MYANGTSIIFEERNNNVIYYIRNSVADLLGIKYNNNICYYVKNLQNDIISIKDSDFKNKVCQSVKWKQGKITIESEYFEFNTDRDS